MMMDDEWTERNAGFEKLFLDSITSTIPFSPAGYAQCLLGQDSLTCRNILLTPSRWNFDKQWTCQNVPGSDRLGNKHSVSRSPVTSVIFFKACCNNPPRNGTATTLRSASCRAQPKTQIQRDPKGVQESSIAKVIPDFRISKKRNSLLC